MKEQVTKFNLEAAFKALNEIEIPQVGGVKPNKTNHKELCESMRPTPKTDCLLEDYYDVNNNEDLEVAAADRAEEVAQAKLAKIEKIVDLDAETPEDIQPSYVGKTIVQCPQCMTLFYRNQEDLNPSEEDGHIVNVGEVCPNCGNDTGYQLVGKVAEVAAEEQADFSAEVPAEENELDLNFEEPAEEENEETPAEENEEELNLEPVEEPAEENKEEEKPEEEKKEESFEPHSENILAEQVENALKEDVDHEILKPEKVEKIKKAVPLILDYYDKIKTVSGEIIDIDILTNELFELGIIDEIDTHNYTYDKLIRSLAGWLDEKDIHEALKEDVDELTKKLKEHDEYIKVLQDEIKAEEEAVKNAKNDFIKKMHEKNLEALKDALDKAIPEEVKAEAAIEELPTAEDAAQDMTKNEALNEEEKCPVCGDELDSKEPCEKCKKELEDKEELKESLIEAKEKEILEEPIEDDIKEEPEEEVKIELTSDEVAEVVQETAAKVADMVQEIIEPTEEQQEEIEEKVDEIVVNKVEEVCPDCEAVIEKEEEIAEEDPEAVDEEPVEEACENCDKEDLKEASVEDELNSFVANLGEECEHCEEAQCAVHKAITHPDEDMKELKEDAAENEEKLAEFEQEIQNEQLQEDGEKCDIALMKDINKQMSFSDMLNDPTFKKFGESIEENNLKEELPANVIAAGEDAVNKLKELNAKAEAELAIEKEIEQDKDVEPEELYDSYINSTITNYLTEVYSNVNNFEVTDCSMLDEKLIIEGNINFKSGKSKATKFEFAKTAKNIYEGINKDLAGDDKFILECFTEDGGKTLMAEKLTYKYHIGDNLVEGLSKVSD